MTSLADDKIGRYLQSDEHVRAFVNQRAKRGNLNQGAHSRDLRDALRKLGELAIVVQDKHGEKIKLLEIFRKKYFQDITANIRSHSSPNQKLRYRPAILKLIQFARGYTILEDLEEIEKLRKSIW